jgi:alanine transaminase
LQYDAAGSYQANVYKDGDRFTSFKKVVRDMQAPIQLFSFHSTSKVAAPASAVLFAPRLVCIKNVVMRLQGVIGECGRRGGYLEITNIPADVKEQLCAPPSRAHDALSHLLLPLGFAHMSSRCCLFRYKLVSIGLCSNLNGQIMTDLMVAPPKPGDASYPLYHQEITGIFSSLKRRATKVRPPSARSRHVSRCKSCRSLPLPSIP